MLGSSADPLFELDQMGPSLGVGPDGVQGTRDGTEAGCDGQYLADAPTAGAQTSREFVRVEPTELPRRPSTAGLRRVSLTTDPSFERSDRSTKESSERGRRQATEVAGSLSWAGDDFKEEHPGRRYQRLRFGEESLARFPGKSQRVSEDRHHRKPPRSKRRSDPVASYQVGCRNERAIHPEKHLLGKVQRDPLGPGQTDVGQESSGPGPDVHDPSPGGGVSPEESDPEHAEQLPLRGAFVPLPLSVGPVRVERLEPLPGGYHPRRDDGRVSVRHAPPVGSAADVLAPRVSNAGSLLPTTSATGEVDSLPYYECPKCGGGYVIDVPASARPVCDRDGARLKRASDASYEKNARRD